MAEEAAEKKEQAEPAKKKPPIVLIGVVGGVMLLEAVAAIGFVMLSGKGAQEAEAEIIHDEHSELDETVEIPVVEEVFPNMQTGRIWGWQVSVVLQVKRKHEEFVLTELERRNAEIIEGVGLIVRRATHSQLKEPGLETINRQLTAYMNTVIEHTPEGEHRVERVLIPKCIGAPGDL